MDLEMKLGELKIEVPYAHRNTLGENYTTIEDLFLTIDDLYFKLDRLQEEFDDYKEYVKDNYRELSQAELIGFNECDFYEER